MLKDRNTYFCKNSQKNKFTAKLFITNAFF